MRRQLLVLIFILLAVQIVAAEEPSKPRTSSTRAASKHEERTPPVIEFDKLVEEGDRRYAKFRLTNPGDKVATYAGPSRNNPSVVFYTPHNLTRKLVNFWEYWSGCGLDKRMHIFEIRPGEEVEFKIALPKNPKPFRLSSEILTTPNFSAVVEVD